MPTVRIVVRLDGGFDEKDSVIEDEAEFSGFCKIVELPCVPRTGERIHLTLGHTEDIMLEGTVVEVCHFVVLVSGANGSNTQIYVDNINFELARDGVKAGFLRHGWEKW